MPTKTWVAGEDINAVDVNSYLQNQMVLQFANASERAAEISRPTVGMVSFLNSTGGFEIFTDKTTPSSWRPPWNTPWGLVRAAMVYDIVIGPSPGWLIMHLPVNIPGRQYKIEFDTNATPNNLCNTYFSIQTNVAVDIQAYTTDYATWTQRVTLWNVYPGAAANDHGIICNTDSGTSGMGYARVRVFDVGPV